MPGKGWKTILMRKLLVVKLILDYPTEDPSNHDLNIDYR